MYFICKIYMYFICKNIYEFLFVKNKMQVSQQVTPENECNICFNINNLINIRDTFNCNCNYNCCVNCVKKMRNCALCRHSKINITSNTPPQPPRLTSYMDIRMQEGANPNPVINADVSSRRHDGPPVPLSSISNGYGPQPRHPYDGPPPNDGLPSISNRYGQGGIHNGYGQGGIHNGYGQRAIHNGYGQRGIHNGYGQRVIPQAPPHVPQGYVAQNLLSNVIIPSSSSFSPNEGFNSMRSRTSSSRPSIYR